MSDLWLALLICCVLVAVALLVAARMLQHAGPSTADRFASIFKQEKDEDDTGSDDLPLNFSVARLLERFEVLTLGGEPHILADDEMARVLERFKNYGQRAQGS